MITIRNEYHNTEVRVRASIGEVLTSGQVKRCRRALCGIDGCTCGGVLSERGQQHDDAGRAFDVIAIGADSARLEGAV